MILLTIILIVLHSYRDALPKYLECRQAFAEQARSTRGPWKNIDAVEYATLEWVDWFNNRRLLEPIGDVPPAEFEQAYYEQLEGQAKAA